MRVEFEVGPETVVFQDAGTRFTVGGFEITNPLRIARLESVKHELIAMLVDLVPTQECPDCHGTGIVPGYREVSADGTERTFECPCLLCEGTGEVLPECSVCGQRRVLKDSMCKECHNR